MLMAALAERPREGGARDREEPYPPGRLGRDQSVALEAIHVFDAVAPRSFPSSSSPAGREGGAGPVRIGHRWLASASDQAAERLPERLEAPLAIGPELDADGLSERRARLAGYPGVEVVPLWLRSSLLGLDLLDVHLREVSMVQNPGAPTSSNWRLAGGGTRAFR